VLVAVSTPRRPASATCLATRMGAPETASSEKSELLLLVTERDNLN